jgi:Cof subfamily protein (haloacid dehalogenase superfamily)
MSQPTSQDIRLIAIDLDGTLLDPQSKVTERTAKAVQAAANKGIAVVFATGKTYTAVAPLIKRFNLSTPSVCLQGLATYKDGKIVHQQTLNPNIARQVITYAEDRGFVVILYSGTRILMRSYDERVIEAVFRRYHEPDPEIVGPLQNIVNDLPIHKMAAVSGDPRAIKALRWQLNAQIGGGARLMQAGVPQMVEILPPGASKGAAVRQVLKDLRIDPAHVLAIGDAENDMEMIQLAGVGVAMGQAEQIVKDGADHVVASNAADGAAEAIERFALGIDPNAPKAADANAAESPSAATQTDAPKAADANAAASPSAVTQTDAPKAAPNAPTPISDSDKPTDGAKTEAKA